MKLSFLCSSYFSGTGFFFFEDSLLKVIEPALLNHFFALRSVWLLRSENFAESVLVLGSIRHDFSLRDTSSPSKVPDGSSVRSISEGQEGNQSSINPMLLKENELLP